MPKPTGCYPTHLDLLGLSELTMTHLTMSTMHNDSMKTNLVKNLLFGALILFATPNLRADAEQTQMDVLRSGAAAPQKSTACQQLRVIGTAKCVPALAALLGDERLSQAARYALEGMPCPEAGAALREALGKTSGLLKVGVIDSLGWRRDVAAAPVLVPLLSSSEAPIASAAATALGRIGSKEAIAALSAKRDKVSEAVQTALLESLLRCAEALAAEGNRKGALRLYGNVYRSKAPAPIHAAAWRGMAMSDAGQRAQLITKEVITPGASLRPVALKMIREWPDTQVIKALLRHWSSLQADAQLAVLDADVQRGREALGTVRKASESPHLSVRVAAWQAYATLNDASAMSNLARAAAQAEPAEREAARNTLARLHGPGVREALLATLSGAEASQKAEILRALGERGDMASCSVLLQNATSPEPLARAAALESLRRLAPPEALLPLLNLSAKTASDAAREPVLRVVYAICQTSKDKEATSRQVVGAVHEMAPPQRRLVLPVLGELATPAALEEVRAATQSKDPELAKEGVLVLSQWPNALPAPYLLEMARTTSEGTLQTLALRGAIEVSAQEPDPGRRLTLLQEAVAAAKRTEERKQAFGQIGQIPTREALQIVLPGLEDPTLANEAGLAAISIAEKLAVADPKLADEVAVKVLARCKSAEMVKRAWALRAKPQSGGAFIQDWLVSGPYSQAGAAGAQALFNIAFAPEKEGEKAQWKPAPRGDQVNLSVMFPGQDNCAAYLRTRIVVAEDLEGALLMASDDGIRAWLNGVVVHSNNVDRGAVVDQDMAPIKLKKGANELMFKVSQGGGGWMACARIVGVDGLPIPGLRVEVP